MAAVLLAVALSANADTDGGDDDNGGEAEAVDDSDDDEDVGVSSLRRDEVVKGANGLVVIFYTSEYLTLTVNSN